MSEIDSLTASERASLDRVTEPDDPTAVAADRGLGTEGTGAYVEGLLRRPMVGAEREAELVVRAKGGDVEAREQLVEHFMPRLMSVARRHVRPGVELPDLLQEGFLALFDALHRFDPDRGVPFWGYATTWVHGAVQRLARDQLHAIRLPPRARSDLVRIKRAANELARDGHGRVSLTAAAQRSGLDLARAEALVAAGRPARSLDEPLAATEGMVVLGDVLPDPAAEAAYDAVVEGARHPELSMLLGSLSAREREVLARRHGIGCERQTLDAIGRDLGVTRERVRQIESRAIAKLGTLAGLS